MTSQWAGRSLLPANATPWEQALSLTSAEARDIDADAIRRAFDPWTCPASLLPWLAYSYSVDFWSDKWSESKKRRVIARAIRLQWLKGTEAGIEEYIELADARLLSVTVPPQRVFSGKSQTKEEREAWLSRLPQIRTWRVFERGTRGLKMFSGSGLLFHAFREGRFLQPSVARSMMRRRARWVVDGQEQDARVDVLPDGFRVSVKGKAGARVFSGRVIGKFFQPSDAAARIFTIGFDIPQPWRTAVAPTLKPVSTQPDRIFERGTRDRRVFVSTHVRSGFFQPSAAWRRIYLRYPVNDGKPGTPKSNVQFMGTGRFGWPAHVAALRVSLPGKRPVYAAGEGLLLPKSRFWLPHNGEPMKQLRRAIRAGMRVSDRVLIAPAPRPGLFVGTPILIGEPHIIGRAAAATT